MCIIIEIMDLAVQTQMFCEKSRGEVMSCLCVTHLLGVRSGSTEQTENVPTGTYFLQMESVVRSAVQELNLAYFTKLYNLILPVKIKLIRKHLMGRNPFPHISGEGRWSHPIIQGHILASKTNSKVGMQNRHPYQAARSG